jgi:preprotein translocase subunit SecA
MFAAMMDAIKEESVGFLFNLEVQVEDEAPAEPAEAVGAQPQLDLSMLAAAQEAHEEEHSETNANGARPQVTAKGLDREDQGDKSFVYSSPELGSDAPSVQTSGGTGSSGDARKPRPSGNRRPTRSNPNRGSRGNKRKR